MQHNKFTNTQVVVVSLALAAIIFLIDISVPLGVAGGVPYVAVVLVSLWSPRKNLVLYVALLCAFLTLTGYLLSPAGGEFWKIFANRFIALFAIWVTALLGMGRKRAEAELRESHDILEERVEQRTVELVAERDRASQYLGIAGVLFVALNASGEVTLINSKGCEVLGYSEDEILGKNWFENFLPERIRGEIIPISKQLLSGKLEPIEYHENPVLTKGGEERLIAWHNSIIKDKLGNVTGHLSSGEDITERKHSEEAMSQSEALLAEAQKIAHLGHWRLDVETQEITGSDELFRIFGIPREEADLATFIEIVHPEDRARDVEAITRGMEKGENWSLEHRLICRDGTEKTVFAVGQARVDETGKVIELVGTIQDITERKKSEETLRAQDERFRSVLENTPTIIFIKDLDSRYLYINKNWEEVFHTSREDVVGKLDIELFPKDAADAVRLNDLKVVEANKPLEFEEVIPHEDGLHTYLSVKFPLYDASGKIEALCCIATDITERTRLEQESLKAQKLESVGVLAGGIAHDFNNLLTGIIGNLSLVEHMVEKGGVVYEKLQDVERAAMKASSLTQQLLTFSKGGEPIKSIISVGELIWNTANFALRGSNVKCTCCPAPDDLWNVDADEGQLSQVINNLTINANQAMPSGGELKVSAENYTIEQRSDLPLPAGRYVKVTFEDNGTGIHKDLLPKIFDPYFTTKQKGSGLGLASSYSVIKRHGGHMEVASELGVGTTFSIYLPAVSESVESGVGAVVKKSEEETVQATAGARVLVMDDEEIIRDVATELLVHFGYEVATAEDGKEAVKMYKEAMEAKEPFGLVIIDITIPGGVGGKEAFKMLHGVDPNVKAIVSSGYSNDPIMSSFKEYGFVDCVAKPYRVTTLGEKVARAFKGDG